MAYDPVRYREWYLKNRDKKRAQSKAAFLADPEKARRSARDNYTAKREKILSRKATKYKASDVLRASRSAYLREYNARPHVRERKRLYMREYQARERASSPEWRIAGSIRSRIRGALKKFLDAKKCCPTEHLTGCSIERLVLHLERQFAPGMSWENYGHKGDPCWVIDHIRPVAAFDLTIPADQLACFHFTNMRPLWSKANREKWHRIELLL